MHLISRHWFVLVCIVLFAAGMQAHAQDLQSPDWQILLDGFGYSNRVLVTFPAIPAHEVLTGDWAAAVRFDGIPTDGGESMFLPPKLLGAGVDTNSTFEVVGPLTTFHDPANPVPGNNSGSGRIVNEELLIDLIVEMRLVPGGMAIGLRPGGLGSEGPLFSSQYVMVQTYRIQNISGSALNNFAFYQLLHSHPNDDNLPNNFGVFDPTLYNQGGMPEHHYDITTFGASLREPEGSDLVGFSSSVQPTAFGLGTLAGHVGAPPPGILQNIYADTLPNTPSAGPTEIAGAMKWSLGNLAPGQIVPVTVAFWVANAAVEPPPPPGPHALLQAYPGSSEGTNVHYMGHLGNSGDTISAVPGVLSIVPGDKWSNFVRAAQEGIPYNLKNVTLCKQTPSIIQCADVFPAKTICQQGTSGIRRWWPLMYEVPGTTWTLTIQYGTNNQYDDDGAGPNPAGYYHSQTRQWYMDATLDSMKDLLALFHELPFGLDEVPLISDEVLYPVLLAKLGGIAEALDGPEPDLLSAAMLLGDFEMEVMDACISVSPARPRPTGPGTGIANSEENPACCKLLADIEYIGRTTGAFQTVK